MARPTATFTAHGLESRGLESGNPGPGIGAPGAWIRHGASGTGSGRVILREYIGQAQRCSSSPNQPPYPRHRDPNLLVSVSFVSQFQVATQGIKGLTFCFERAMLQCNREPHSDVLLTSGVSFEYTASLRCTNSSSAPQNPRGVAAGRFACARCTVRHKLGRTPVGSLAQRLSYRPWSPSCFLRSHR